MLEYFQKMIGMFAFLGAVYGGNLLLPRLFPSFFARTGMFYSRFQGSRKIRSLFEMHAIIFSMCAFIFLVILFVKDVNALYLLLLFFISGLMFELSENSVWWNSDVIIQRRAFVFYKKIKWKDVVALNINMPLNEFRFSDGLTSISFEARFSINSSGERFEPSKENAAGVLLLARYARLKLRGKPNINWAAV